jgi:hypothetical protein
MGVTSDAGLERATRSRPDAARATSTGTSPSRFPPALMCSATSLCAGARTTLASTPARSSESRTSLVSELGQDAAARMDVLFGGTVTETVT